MEPSVTTRPRQLAPAILFVLCCLLLSAPPAHSLTKNPRFQHYGVDDGLSISTVLCSAQDKDGFLWFGTYDGLNRFDGQRFIVYRNDPEDPKSIADNNIRALAAAPDGTLWVGTKSGGLNRLPPDRSGFQTFRSAEGTLPSDEITALLLTPAGDLWVGTAKGLAVKRADTSGFAPLAARAQGGESLTESDIQSLADDGAGGLWVGSGRGLFRLTAEGALSLHKGCAPENATMLSLMSDGADAVLIGTDTYGLYRYDTATGACENHLGDAGVQAFLRDTRGNLVVGTSMGVAVSAPGPLKFVIHTHNPYDPQSLAHDDVHSLLEDSGGMVWIGTYSGGLSKFNPSYQAFGLLRHEPWNPDSLSGELVSAIYLGRDDTLWVGTSYHGLNRVDRKSGQVRVFKNDPENPASLSDDRVSCILEDTKGRLWVGTVDQGLNRLDRTTETFLHYRHDKKAPSSLSQDKVWWLFEDRDGFIWVGTSKAGLNRLDPETGVFTHYRHDPKDPTSISHDRVRHVMQTRDGALWIGTNAGLNRFDQKTGKFTHWENDPADSQSLSNNRVTPIVEEPDGALWVGTDGGLNRYDPATGTFRRFLKDDSGLPSDAIQGMLLDENGGLWLSHYRGISRLDTKTFDIRNYSARDGLQGPEFWMNAAHKGFTGEMFFGGQKGLSFFYPANIRPNMHEPSPALTGFTVFNKPYPLAGDISAAKNIRLLWEDRVFTLGFASLDYTDPKRNQTAYMLEGFDKDWTVSDGVATATYTNLNPGDYVFKIKAANNNGIWNPAPRELAVRIAPPFWRTLWFTSLMVFLGLLAAYGLYRWRISSLLARRLELEETVLAQTASLRNEIEERRLTEERLRQSRDSFTKIFEHTPLAVTISDLATGALLQVNKAFCDLVGRTPEEALGRTGVEIGIWKSMEDRARFFDEILRHGLILNYETTFLTNNAEEIASLCSATTIEAFGRTCILNIVLDITARKKLEAEIVDARMRAEQANQAKSAFLANMSHEIRTPLTGIIGLTRLLLDETPAGRTHEALKLVQDSGRMLLEILNDILDLSKIEAGKLEIEAIPFDPRRELRSALSLAEIMARDKGLTFTKSFSTGFPAALRGDPIRLRQVLNNLLSNAVKFTESGGVTVALEALAPVPGAEGTRLRITVSDTGIGIAEDQLPRLFSSFTQADGSMSRRYGGTGLGLAISKRLVELMNGSIEATSRPGEGSTFTCSVMVGDASPDELPEAPAETGETPDVRPLRILVAEDHQVNRLLLRQFLMRHGHQVTLVENGFAAIDALQAERFDVVILDGQMPGMDGMETARNIRALSDPDKAGVPIVGLTAHALPEYRERFLDAGIDSFFVKPPDTSALVAELERLAGRRTLAAAPGDGQNYLIDQDVLRSYVGDNPEMIARVVSLFRQSFPEQVEQMGTALVQLDFEQVHNLAHKLKTTFRIFGAQAALDCVVALEAAAHAKNGEECANGLERLKKLTPTLAAEVKKIEDALQL